MSIVRRGTDLEYARRMREMFGTDISSESELVDFSRFCCSLLFSFFCPIREVETWGGDVDLELRKRS